MAVTPPREVTIFEAFGGRIADTPGFASLEASRAGFIPKRVWNTPSRSSGLTSARASSPAAPTAPRRAAPSAPPLAAGKLSQTRYDSYCAMYDEVKDVKEWQYPLSR